MIRSAIFDLDGTLVDTAGDLIAAMNAVAHRFDLPEIDPVEGRPAAGKGGRGLMRHAAAKVGRVLTDDQILAAYPPFLDAYEARISERSCYFPGAEAALDALIADGWRVGVCTNKPERLARMLIDRLGGGGRYGVLLGADSLPVRKPDPLHVLTTIERLGGAPERAVMVGDTETDRLAAAAAGVPCALFAGGFSSTPVADLKPEAVFETFEQLPALAARLIGKPLDDRARPA